MGYLIGHLMGSKVLEEQMIQNSAEARKMEAENVLMQLRHNISEREIRLKSDRKKWALGEIRFKDIVTIHSEILSTKGLYDAILEEVRLAVEDEPKSKK